MLQGEKAAKGWQPSVKRTPFAGPNGAVIINYFPKGFCARDACHCKYQPHV